MNAQEEQPTQPTQRGDEHKAQMMPEMLTFKITAWKGGHCKSVSFPVLKEMAPWLSQIFGGKGTGFVTVGGNAPRMLKVEISLLHGEGNF